MAGAWWLAVLSLAGCAATLSTAPRRVELGVKTTVPVRLVRGVPFVEVTIDGAPHTFAIDLGASTTVVSGTLATRLRHQERTTAITLYDAAGRSAHAPRRFARLDLTVGDAQFRDVDVLEFDDIEALGALIGFRVDGVLGWPLFTDVLLTIDYPAATVTLERGRLAAPDGEERFRIKWEQNLPTVLVELAGKPQRVVVDTGAMATFDFPSAVLAGAATAAPWVATTAAHNALGTSPQTTARLAADVRLGRYRFATPIVKRSTGGACIGGLALQSFVLTVDVANDVVRLHREGDATVPTPSTRNLGFSLHKQDGHWRIDELLVGAPASTDVRLGDRVVAVDGAAADALTLTDWKRAIDERPALRLMLDRDGRTVEATVDVFELVH